MVTGILDLGSTIHAVLAMLSQSPKRPAYIKCPVQSSSMERTELRAAPCLGRKEVRPWKPECETECCCGKTF